MADSDAQPVVTCSFDGHPVDDPLNIHVEGGQIYCDHHFAALFLPKCHGCGEPIRGEFIKLSDGTQWHSRSPHCWKCADCQCDLTEDSASTLQFDANVYLCRPCGLKRASSMGGERDAKAAEALSRLEELKRSKEREAKEAASSAGKVVPPESSPTYRLDQLKKSNPKRLPIDPSKRELYLSDGDFQSNFKMTKSEFAKLPKWKQDNVKRGLDLF